MIHDKQQLHQNAQVILYPDVHYQILHQRT
jgi:hypothetical protein